ncbi:MAG: hypothetical protein CMN31_03980 [Sandaracinus sp.]|nr:hypothetical protein [Myxococcales bacterium]MAT27004.1 hypothetical protein [Sandaracinus sp.]MBJ70518.1 hypothetical protein [Sandaracinus sp.]
MEASGRPTVMSLIGAVIDGQYRILDLVGEGGMGAVFRAQQQDGSYCAIKVLHDELTDDPALKERFEREARALFGLQHPNILGVFDYGVVNGMPYLAMELLEGQSLSDLIEDSPPDPELALDLALQVLEGLAFAHRSGVLHRDLKTENVFVARDAAGRPVAKLLDFGLVKFVDDERWGSSKKLTVQGSVFGTPAYMAPEQCAGAPVDTRGDVYSAGVILFELFTGIWPFMEESRIAMFQAHLTKPPPRIGDVYEGELVFRNQLEEVVQKALAKMADQRFQNADEMLAALKAVPRPVAQLPSGAQRISASGPQLAPAAAPMEVAPKNRQSQLVLMAVAVAIVVIAAAVAVFVVMM